MLCGKRCLCLMLLALVVEYSVVAGNFLGVIVGLGVCVFAQFAFAFHHRFFDFIFPMSAMRTLITAYHFLYLVVGDFIAKRYHLLPSMFSVIDSFPFSIVVGIVIPLERAKTA